MNYSIIYSGWTKRVRECSILASIVSVLLCSGMMAGVSPAEAADQFCSDTARAALIACRFEVLDDFWTASGICNNFSDEGEREECVDEAREELGEARELCGEQFGARRELCDALGEAPYDPEFDPADFVDPRDIGDTVAANPYFPLIPCSQWVYEGGDETITVTVTNKVKLIEGVKCIVVNDLVEEDGEVIEDTDDWFAQDSDGNVWYCGEIALNFETFEGDDPEEPELVDIEGSWKAFRDGARPGFIMKADRFVGDIYRQEFALGDAEDVAEIISTSGSATVPAASCDGDCVETLDFTPLEPDIFERKVYAPGIGLILEVDQETFERVELTDFQIGGICEE